ncbi:hypothetical protein EKO29_16095 [Colwellia sp. Arc7-635]|jgi:hypothetical protein|uniref:hypothetical protein n=1 Tax=Colwellia sp. Arc7-635 TaxID=2497879 RepID=UPI000F84F4BF|nr:hypothetical protein [Colwellia sp. Arc7-635]AZQ85370.1 hypothetical protein EKO29_16095 [Colwellia sp. Arc7-635]
MKESIAEIKDEINKKLLYWKNLKSKKAKLFLIIIALGLIGLKVFTTVLTFDWLTSLFNTV